MVVVYLVSAKFKLDASEVRIWAIDFGVLVLMGYFNWGHVIGSETGLFVWADTLLK